MSLVCGNVPRIGESATISVLCLKRVLLKVIDSNIFVTLPDNFQAKNLIFAKPIFPIPYHLIWDYVAEYLCM